MTKQEYTILSKRIAVSNALAAVTKIEKYGLSPAAEIDFREMVKRLSGWEKQLFKIELIADFPERVSVKVDTLD